MHSATSLLARNVGEHRCFYCGAPADCKLVLSSSFIDWWIAKQPESKHICRGCEISIDEKIDIPGKDKKQKTRNYSWLITSERKQHYTKGDKLAIAEVLLNPPPAPWAFAIAESGQKHLLYRTPVNSHDAEPYAVQLELTTVSYTPAELRERMELARKVVAAVGHKGASSPNLSLCIAADAETLERWLNVLHEPLTALALYVTPSQKDCSDDKAA